MQVAFGRVRRKTEPTGGGKCLFIFRFHYKSASHAILGDVSEDIPFLNDSIALQVSRNVG